MQHPAKKSSVLAFFHHTFVVSDIFGSEKILCPAWVLGSAALLPAASSVEKSWSLFSRKCTPHTISFGLLWWAFCDKLRAALRKSCVENPVRCLAVTFSAPRKILRPALVSWCAHRNYQAYIHLISKILRPACLVSKY